MNRNLFRIFNIHLSTYICASSFSSSFCKHICHIVLLDSKRSSVQYQIFLYHNNSLYLARNLCILISLYYTIFVFLSSFVQNLHVLFKLNQKKYQNFCVMIGGNNCVYTNFVICLICVIYLGKNNFPKSV